MSDIPTDVFREILSWLPVKPLLQFRCVCKSWRSIIDDPQFLKLQFHRRKFQEDEEDLMLTISTKRVSIYSGSLYSAIDLISLTCAQTRRRTKTIELSSIKSSSFFISKLPLPVCRGLILLPDYGMTRVWALVNICTGDLLFKLPVFPNPFHKFSHGLGYVASTDDYKVVRIATNFPSAVRPVFKTCIYSLKSKVWRIIEDFLNSRVEWLSKQGVFCNGALHWIRYLNDGNHVTVQIIALNLATETYCTIPMPPRSRSLHLDAIGGQLFLSAKDDCFEVWMLEGYGGENMWVKLVSLRLPFPDSQEKVRVVAYVRAKQQVLIRYTGEILVWFDVKKQVCMNEITVMGDVRRCSYQMLPAILMKRASNDRLQLKVRKNPTRFGIL